MHQRVSGNYEITRKVTLVGGIFDGLLGILKVVVGLIGQSQALVADGVHSFSDLATDLLVIWAARHAKEGPDEKHPYGHERIETLATMILAVALIAVAFGFAYDAVMRLAEGDRLQQPGWLVLGAALISTLTKEGIYHYTMRAARQINSKLLRANAWHSRSDAASSIIVVLGVIGVMLGFEYADALASIGVSMMIGWIGWELGHEGVEELIDTSADPETLDRMLTTIKGIEGVRDAHQIRTRRMAGKIVMDTHITVDSTITVSEGHRIGDAVERALHQQFKELSDITVHIDHENDFEERPSYHLPLRSQVLSEVRQAMESHCEQLDGLKLEDFMDIRLHYLDGNIQLELWRQIEPRQSLDLAPELEDSLQQALHHIPYISRVSVVYRLRPGERPEEQE